MNRLKKGLTIGLAITLILIFTNFSYTKKHKFSYAIPESKGYSSEKLEILKRHLEKSGSSSMILMVDGDIIFEWGETSKKHVIHSIRKALLNSLYGIAIDRGQIDTSMTLRELKIDDIDPKLSDNELNARIADLLKSRSGVYHDAAGVNKVMLIDKPERDTFKPGEHYYYNNWDFNVLGAILEKQTGKSIYELFNKEIAKPLGMHDYKGKFSSINGEPEDAKLPDTDGFYQYEKSKSNYPAYHFRMSARDLALYGQLYINYGIWSNTQIISQKWIDLSTEPYSIYNAKYRDAYGMLWNVRVPDEKTKRNSFGHSGLGIHWLGIFPDSKLVVVHRVDTEKDYEYKKPDFYKMIGLIFSSKTK